MKQMTKTATQPFYLEHQSGQTMQKGSTFIFDDTYKSKLNKNKFERNPKFAYFNTIVKIKNKLCNNPSGLYDLVFDPEQHVQANRKQMISTSKSKHETSLNWRRQVLTQNTQHNQSKQNIDNGPASMRNSVKQIYFETHKHRRGESEMYYDRKPRLDDILAQYRRVSKRQKQRNKSFSYNATTKISDQWQIVVKDGRYLPRQVSNSHRRKLIPKA